MAIDKRYLSWQCKLILVRSRRVRSNLDLAAGVPDTGTRLGSRRVPSRTSDLRVHRRLFLVRRFTSLTGAVRPLQENYTCTVRACPHGTTSISSRTTYVQIVEGDKSEVPTLLPLVGFVLSFPVTSG